MRAGCKNVHFWRGSGGGEEGEVEVGVGGAADGDLFGCGWGRGRSVEWFSNGRGRWCGGSHVRERFTSDLGIHIVEVNMYKWKRSN